MHEKGICNYQGNPGGAIKMEAYCGVKHMKHSKLTTQVFHGTHIMEDYL
jgi:hypothetical protein